MNNNLIHRLALIAVLAALCSTLRIWFAFLPNVKPITAMFFAFSLFLGLTNSLWIMIITILVTGVFLGFSPIIFGQIIVYTIIIVVFRLLSRLTTKIWILSLLTVPLVFSYGICITLFSGIIYGFGTSGFLGYYLSGVPFDFVHALSTFIIFPPLAFFMNRLKIRRQHI